MADTPIEITWGGKRYRFASIDEARARGFQIDEREAPDAEEQVRFWEEARLFEAIHDTLRAELDAARRLLIAERQHTLLDRYGVKERPQKPILAAADGVVLTPAGVAEKREAPDAEVDRAQAQK